jgi:hypothetical protein
MSELREMDFPLKYRRKHSFNPALKSAGSELTEETEEMLRFEAEACCPAEGWDDGQE